MPSVTFGPDGLSWQSWTVPAGITEIVVTLAGAEGATPASNSTNVAGKGALIVATLAVTPAETLDLKVGQKGLIGGYSGGAQPGGRGLGSFGGGVSPATIGGGGGGGTGISRSTGATWLAVAGAGGGAGAGSNGGAGGDGGTNGVAGGNGIKPTGAFFDPIQGGGGASTSGAGGGGQGALTAVFWHGGSGVSNGNGGIGGLRSTGASGWYGGGGGGGGWYGGGGGGGVYPDGGGMPGGGGGGSSLVPSGATITAGYQSGDGFLTIQWGHDDTSGWSVGMIQW